MYRFSLRNQNRIKEKLGEDFLKWLVDSLSVHFNSHEQIEEFEYPDNKEKYKVVIVNNVQPHTDSQFELYVISRNFNVYNLAYKSCMG
jgi:hypothetical protein